MRSQTRTKVTLTSSLGKNSFLFVIRDNGGDREDHRERVHQDNNGRSDDEALEDDIIGGEDEQDASDEGEGEDLVENMEA